MNRSTPGLPVHHQLPEFTQTHVHRVSDAIQPSHPLSFPSPPAPNPSQHQGLFQWVSWWPKYWSFSFSISPSNEHPGLISFRMDWLDLLAVQGTFKSLLLLEKFKSINSLALSFLHSPTLTSIHDHCYAPAAATAAKSLHSCPTLCNPLDGSPPGSTTPGILQARTLEWVAISFSNAWKWKMKVKLLSRHPMDYSPPGSSVLQNDKTSKLIRSFYQLFWTDLQLVKGKGPVLRHSYPRGTESEFNPFYGLYLCPLKSICWSPNP